MTQISDVTRPVPDPYPAVRTLYYCIALSFFSFVVLAVTEKVLLHFSNVNARLMSSTHKRVGILAGHFTIEKFSGFCAHFTIENVVVFLGHFTIEN